MLNEVTQHSIKTLSWLLIALAALFAAIEFGRSVDQTYPTRSFSVEGSGEAEIVPDVAKFSVSVISEGGKDVAAVQNANSEKMSALNKFLKDSGVDDEDLKTEQYSLSPRYEYPNCIGLAACPQPTISGYSLTQSLQVTVRDTDKIGDLLMGVIANGGNAVSQVVFTVDDEEGVKAEARKEAVEVAKKKAEQMAKEAGFTVGRLVSIYESFQNPMLGYGGGMLEGDAFKSAAVNGVSSVSPSLEPGMNEVKVSVTLTYEIR